MLDSGHRITGGLTGGKETELEEQQPPTSPSPLSVTLLLSMALLSTTWGPLLEAAEIPALDAYRLDDRRMAEDILEHATFEAERRTSVRCSRRWGFVRRAFESKLTAAHRIGPELSEQAFREREGFLEKLHRIRGLAPSQLGEFEALVRAQPPRGAV